MGESSKIGIVCDDFNTVKLKSVLVKNDAGDWGSNPDENAIGIIRSTNFNNNGVLDLSDVAYRTLNPNKKEEKKLHVGDILIERSGGSDTQPVGRVGLITERMLKEDFAFANFIQRISVKKDEFSPDYLYYCLQQMYEMGITASMQAQTTGIRNLDWKQYVKTILPQPSLPEQSAIAHILSTVDEAIRSTRDTISKLERVKKSLMQNLLSGKMKPDGTLRPAAEFYEDEKMGLVPKGWKSMKLKEVALRPGEYGANASAIKYETGNARFIRITDINDDGTLSEEDKAGLDNEIAQKYLLKEDDFLFARTGDTIGKSLLYKESMGPAAFAGYLIKFTFDKQKIVPELFQLIANSEIFEAFKVSMKRVGAKPNINSREYGNFRFIIPTDIKSQKQIVKSFEPITKQIINNNNKITKLELLKKSLMQQLLTGKVRVK